MYKLSAINICKILFLRNLEITTDNIRKSNDLFNSRNSSCVQYEIKYFLCTYLSLSSFLKNYKIKKLSFKFLKSRLIIWQLK